MKCIIALSYVKMIHIHPPYRQEYDGHYLKIMSFNRDLSKEEYEEFNAFLTYKA